MGTYTQSKKTNKQKTWKVRISEKYLKKENLAVFIFKKIYNNF